MNKIERCPFFTCTFAQWQGLRQIVFGQCPCLVRSEFFSRGPGMVFREAEQQLAYGLTFIGGDMTPLARSVLMIVQAQVLRTLLFETDPNKTLKSRYIIWYNLIVDRYYSHRTLWRNEFRALYARNAICVIFETNCYRYRAAAIESDKQYRSVSYGGTAETLSFQLHYDVHSR